MLAGVKIAVVGAGLAGVALTYWLSKGGAEVTLYDEVGLAGGASGIAPGLLHPYTGRKARTSARERQGLDSTLALIDLVGEDVIRSRGIVRFVLEEAPFREAASQPDVTWWSASETAEKLDCEPLDAVFIESGLTLNVPLYLERLFALSGATLIQEHVDRPSGYDATVLATGPAIHLDVDRVRGQMLELRWPGGLPVPPHSLIGRKYLVPLGETCLVGATYERGEPEDAKAEILPHIAAIYPALADAEVLATRVGVRVSGPPIAGQIGPNLYALTGLGSKGLLYHSLLAQELAQLIAL
jgi:glycine/D-amino acid oxidase-like deaminating enzyme